MCVNIYIYISICISVYPLSFLHFVVMYYLCYLYAVCSDSYETISLVGFFGGLKLLRPPPAAASFLCNNNTSM